MGKILPFWLRFSNVIKVQALLLNQYLDRYVLGHLKIYKGFFLQAHESRDYGGYVGAFKLNDNLLENQMKML